MSDISKGGFDGKKVAESREAFKNKQDTKNEVPADTQHRQEHLNKVKSENQGRYSSASSSQEKITKVYREKHQDQFIEDKNTKENISKKQLVETEKDKALVKNPILKSKLDLSAKNQPKIQLPENNKKFKPPRPSLKSLLAKKGIVNRKMSYKELIDLNPSLKKVSSQNIDNLQELGKILGGQYIAEIAENENKQNKLSGTKKSIQQASIADIFQLGDEILDLKSDEIQDLISELTEGLESDEIKDNIATVLNLFQENKPIQNQLLLFFPLPLPFEFRDIDEDFEEELEELRKENQEKDAEDETYDEEDEDEDEEFDADMEAAISIHTYNFGKLIALLRFSKSLNKFEITFKGAPNAEELAIALGSNLEFELPFQTNIKERRYKTWKNKTFPNIPADRTRPSIIETSGEPDEQFIKACKIIFKSIEKSDQEVTQFEANKEGKIV